MEMVLGSHQLAPPPTGGTAPLSYTLEVVPQEHDGLSFNGKEDLPLDPYGNPFDPLDGLSVGRAPDPNERAPYLSGVPTVSQAYGEHEYLLTAIDANGLTADLVVEIRIRPDAVPNPTLKGVGRDRLVLQWPFANDKGLIHDRRPHTKDTGRGKWEWTADDPSSASATWDTLNEIDVLDPDDDEVPDFQIGHATGLNANSTYNVWIRATTGGDADARPGPASASSVTGTTAPHVPVLWCIAADEYEKLHPYDFNDQPDFTLVRECPESLSFTLVENFHYNPLSVFDAAPVFWNDYDWDGDNMQWSLEAVQPDDQPLLDLTFQMSGNGVLGKLTYERVDFESNPVWIFDVVGKDNREGEDRVRVTVNLVDMDEPLDNWDVSNPFTVLKKTKDGVIVSGNLPDLRWVPPIETYEVRWCKTTPGPCNNNNDAHWNELSLDAATYATQTPSPVPTNNEALEHPTVELRIGGLESGTHYKLRVRARSHEGVNNWSSQFDAETGIPMHFFGDTIGDMRLPVGENVNQQLPEASGGTIPLTYALIQARSGATDLPPGLRFDPDPGTRQLRGRPEAFWETLEYIYRATDGIGDTLELRFDLSVTPPTPGNMLVYGGDGRVTMTWPDQMGTGIEGWQTGWQTAWGGLAWEDMDVTKITSDPTSRLAGTRYGLTNGVTHQRFQVRAFAVSGETRIFGDSSPQSGDVVPTGNSAPAIEGSATVDAFVQEFASLGTLVERFTVTDTNWDKIIWRLEGEDAERFTIRSTGWSEGSLITAGPLDYATDRAHTVTVIANDGFADSAPVTVTIHVGNNRGTGYPSTPGDPRVTSALDTSLSVSWGLPRFNGSPAITDYTVRYCRTSSKCDPKQEDETAADYDWTHAGHTGIATYTTIGGLQPDVEYEVQVRATNANGVGPWSERGTGIPGGTSPGHLLAPAAPTVTATSAHSVRVAWRKPAYTGLIITNYGIAYRKHEQGVLTPWHYYASMGTAMSATISEDVTGRMIYEVRVRAENNATTPPVHSLWSELTLVETIPKPSLIQPPSSMGLEAAGGTPAGARLGPPVGGDRP